MSQYVPRDSTMWREKSRMWDVIGEFTLCSPPVPSDKSTFLNAGRMRAAEQYFEHTALPSKVEYEAWPKWKQDQFADTEWDRRENGVWFYNFGTPTYLTGRHYFYLNYHRYGVQKPDFREAGRRFYWWWEHVMTAANCIGGYLHTRRRDGKTSRFASVGIEGATRIPFFRFPIQSKNEDSAETVYSKEIMPSIEALKECPWFMPEMAGSSRPKREIIFNTPTRQGKGAGNTPDRIKGLNSRIWWAESTETAVDGDGATYHLNDEVAKKQRFNSYARWSVVSKQFEPDGEIIGKGANTSTSDEDDDDAVGMGELFWKNSDQSKLGPNGINPDDPLSRTASGLFRLFVPAYEGMKCDRYGRDTDEGKEHFMRRRRAVEHDPILLLREKRANPFTMDEALLPSVSKECLYNATHIGHVQTALAECFPPIVKRYKLYWVDFAKTKVAATEDEHGRFYMPWLPPSEWQNQVQALGEIYTSRGTVTRWKPLQAERFCAGGDPIDMQDPEGRASQGAGHGFFRWDHEWELKRGKPGYWPSHSLLMEYAERPDDPDDYYEDLLMYCHWMGCTIFPETNKSQILRYFTARGYEKFLAHRPADTHTENTKNQKKAGAASSPLIIGQYVAAHMSFVQQYVGSDQSKDSPDAMQGVNDAGIPYDWRRLPFQRTLSQLLSFVPSEQANRRSHDLAVSLGFTLLNANRYLPNTKPNSGAGGLSLKGIKSLTSMYR